MLALGAAGLGGAWTGSAGADAARPAPTGADAAIQLDGLASPDGRQQITAAAVLAPLTGPVEASRIAGHVSVATNGRNLLAGRRLSVYGGVRPSRAGGIVALEEHRGRGWVTVARTATAGNGGYRLAFNPPVPGSLWLRVRFAGDRSSGPALADLGPVTVYRLAGASWYGGGGPLACGGRLTDSRLGVAHKTLPCGTMVGLRLGNRTVRVPVIDRGPYVAGRDFDLTPATKRALGFGDTGLVWATS
ncbi:MAG: septal ring lytic transglycosylase RlpA family protein [Solirubrobacteraceae bacterium]